MSDADYTTMCILAKDMSWLEALHFIRVETGHSLSHAALIHERDVRPLLTQESFPC